MGHHYSLGWVAGALLLSGCSVYVPMQGAAPEIRRQGQLEITGSYSLTDRFDASATYSPLPHLLVRAAASSKGSRRAASDSSEYAHVGQYEVALGTYWPLGQRGLIGGLATYGALHTDARFRGDGVSIRLFSFYQPPLYVFDGSYRKLSGEVYASWRPIPPLSLGLTYRLAQVRLTAVTNQGQPVEASPIPRSEFMFFARFWPDTQPANLLHLQVALGGSRVLGYDPLTAGDYQDPARQFRLGEAYCLVGLALYPSAWWQKKQQP